MKKCYIFLVLSGFLVGATHGSQIDPLLNLFLEARGLNFVIKMRNEKRGCYACSTCLSILQSSDHSIDYLLDADPVISEAIKNKHKDCVDLNHKKRLWVQEADQELFDLFRQQMAQAILALQDKPRS